MGDSKGCKNEVINELLHLLNTRQFLLDKQEAINIECYEIDIKIKKMRNFYGMQISILQKRLEDCDYSAVGELQSMFEEFEKNFKKAYYRQLKLRRQAEKIQNEILKISDKIEEL